MTCKSLFNSRSVENQSHLPQYLPLDRLKEYLQYHDQPRRQALFTNALFGMHLTMYQLVAGLNEFQDYDRVNGLLLLVDRPDVDNNNNSSNNDNSGTRYIRFPDLMKRFTVLDTLVMEVTTVRFKLPPNVIPDTVKVMALHINNVVKSEFRYDDCLVPGSIPSSVTELTLGHYNLIKLHDTNKCRIVPESVEALVIKDWKFQEGPINIPASVRKLKFNSFDRDINVLSPGIFPTTITEMSLDIYYYSGIFSPGIIPSCVKKLEFRPPFKLEHSVFPPGILDLNTHQIIPGIIPNGVKTLRFFTMSEDVNGKIPASVETCTIRVDYNALWSLTSLELLVNLKNLECTLKRIAIGILPKNLETLTLAGDVDEIEPGSLPNSLKTIKILGILNAKLESSTLPQSLNTLELLNGATHFPPIPTSITKLNYVFKENTAVIPIGGLPDSIKHLTITQSGFSTKNNSKDLSLTAGFLPQYLEVLDLNKNYDLHLDPDTVVIPHTVKELHFPPVWDQDMVDQFSKIFIKLFHMVESSLEIKLNLDLKKKVTPPLKGTTTTTTTATKKPQPPPPSKAKPNPPPPTSNNLEDSIVRF
eukprot:gene10401-12774_t